MALSDYDTFAITETGDPSNGEWMSASGVVVAIYKNWLYVRDPSAWRDGTGWQHPTIMKIDRGEVHYRDTLIYASRGPSNGIYCLVTCGARHDHTFRFMAGIGISGYISPDATSDEGGVVMGDDYIPPTWVGILPAHLIALQAFVRGWDEQIELDFAKGLRFNQGDMYFAQRTEIGLDATKPGEAGTPVIMKLLQDPERHHDE